MDPAIESLGVTIAALMTIFAFTILIKETRLNRIAEYTVLGASAAHWLVAGLVSLRSSLIQRVADGNVLWIPAFLLGFLFYSRYVRKYTWLSRYPTAVLSGTMIALSLRGIIDSDILAQVGAAVLPLNTFDNILVTIFLTFTIWYFVFTYDPKGMVGGKANSYVLKAARYFIMADFGILFGNMIISRYITALGRLVFLLSTWAGVVAA